MTSRFWLFTIVWMVAVFVATPFWMEWFDNRGIGLQIPGIPVTFSELIWALLLAALPPAAVAWRLRAREKSRRR